MSLQVPGIEHNFNYWTGGGKRNVGGVNPFQPQVQGVNGNQQTQYAQYAQYDNKLSNNCGVAGDYVNPTVGKCANKLDFLA